MHVFIVVRQFSCSCVIVLVVLFFLLFRIYLLNLKHEDLILAARSSMLEGGNIKRLSIGACAYVGSNIEAARVPRSAQGSHMEAARTPRSDQGCQIQPALMLRSDHSSRQIEPARMPNSDQSSRIELAKASRSTQGHAFRAARVFC